ncbi:MAG: hypothetical protein IJV06_05625 [Bacteroidaceae bacterium]|nr:hypothetical protein [Bacteroidaceae bacterium]
MNYEEVIENESGRSDILSEPATLSNYSTSARQSQSKEQSMPCTYTDEEFELVLQEAEQGPYVPDEVVKGMFAAWL